MDQKREWTQALKRLILEHYNAVIPPKAVEIVMKLGQDMLGIIYSNLYYSYPSDDYS